MLVSHAIRPVLHQLVSHLTAYLLYRLHKGVYSCSTELCTGVPTHAYVQYCLDRIALLLRNNVKPYMVFDGGYLPSKAGTEDEREKCVE